MVSGSQPHISEEQSTVEQHVLESSFLPLVLIHKELLGPRLILAWVWRHVHPVLEKLPVRFADQSEIVGRDGDGGSSLAFLGGAGDGSGGQ